MRWHLLCLDAGLECQAAEPGSSSQSAASLPAPVLRLTQTQEGQRRGCLHSRAALHASLRLAGWSRQSTLHLGLSLGQTHPLI